MEYSKVIKTINKIIVANLVTFATITACYAAEEKKPSSDKAAASMTSGMKQTKTKELITGTVKETMNAGGYTYMSFVVNGEARWVAGPKTFVKAGSTVSIVPPMSMPNFKSAALKREFKMIYFTSKIITGKIDIMKPGKMTNTMPELAKAGATDPHAGMDMSKTATTPAADSIIPNDRVKTAAKQSHPIKGIKKVDDGKTISDVLKQKKELAGKSVKIRGQVIKYTSEVMNKNWIHIKDSSTGDDLTITTSGSAKVGDTIIVDGKIAVNKDFGYGYIYPVIVEDAKLTIEK